ncbi:MAG: hypothetical protein ABDI20_08635 [Candidatus Bipolaricaulaceae bacterium]
MARCQALTRTGRACRREAAPGSEFCPVHLRKPPAPMIPVILGADTLCVRYLGRGFFRAFDQEFTPQYPERLLPADQARFLVQTYPKLFVLRP